MAKTNKYVHFNTRAAFDTKCPNPSAAEGNEFYNYTVFIKDTGEIYTHGRFYGKNEYLDVQPTNEIWYTTTDGNIISPWEEIGNWTYNHFWANILSNRYDNGIGIITFDRPVTKIDGAFQNDGGTLETISIPNSVTAIGDGSFNGCTNLIDVNLPKNLSSIGAWAFSSTAISSFDIPSGITDVAEYAFWGCFRLKHISIPDSVTNIGLGALGEGNFKNITIPKNVTNIAGEQFSFVENLYIKSLTPPVIDDDVFYDVDTSVLKIYVPINSVEAYKTANEWSKYSNNIVGCIFNDEVIVPGEKLAKASYILPFAFDDVFQDEPANGSRVEYRISEDDYANILKAVVNESSIILSCRHRFAAGVYDGIMYGGCLYATSSLKDDLVYLHFYDAYSSNNLEFEIGPEGDVYCRVYATQPYLTSGKNIKTINGESVLGSGNLDVTITSTTYANLKALRDNSQLIPGMKYRIIDYLTTTSQENTLSAGHQFDIIVTALDNHTLSEEASACLHKGDTYFSSANAKLEAWKIWYCLDNDNARFAWADTVNGKGIIYRMIDEWNNECPYDFKNIQFLRGLYADGAGIALNSEEDFTAYCYTFGWENEDGTMLDATIFGNNGHLLNDEGQISGVHGNIIKEYFTYTGEIENPASTQRHLNNIVFLSTYSYEDGLYYGYRNNSFGAGCYNNSFGNYCNDNSFGDDCDHNSFGDSCSDNSFGNNCNTNSFGNSCDENSFCHCSGNSFGNDCSSNSFGYSCSGNSFGNNCNFNSFGNDCHNNKIEMAYTEYCHFDDGCSCITLTNNETSSIVYAVKNYKIMRGVSGTWSSQIEIATERNRAYETKVAKNSAGEIKIYCEADLIA